MRQEPHLLSLEDAGTAARWHTLWTCSPQRCAFAAWPYARALAETMNLEAAALFVEVNGTDEAGVLLFRRRRGPYRTAVVPPFTAFTPLVFRHMPPEAALHARTSAFETALATLERHFDGVALHLHPTTTDVRVCRWRGWSVTPLYTYCIRLADEPTLLDGWSAGARRTFRNHREAYRLETAEEAGVVVHLVQKSLARQGRPLPVPPAALAGLVTRLHEAGLVRLFSLRSRKEGIPEAAVALLHDGRTAHYWLAGSRPGPAMTVLLGLLWPRLHREGMVTFDFVGANTPSIAEFKRRFGPHLTPYFRIEKTRPLLLRLLDSLTKI
ncbi:GNAT family N-acetyltransferase [Rhodocaloribacter litoris]|uniref:GNAT family N-acetyltransferase n=1 Tax=Rhodocaloribacter litoris TaxID=2558931 RepID=UPI0014216C2B|nr:GNAT family N-acetyltransferase [Rhodocaloribacter litoris]QXD14857.1 GNAT family N-acetyltransferase [Rhodocaloribacter litoris]